MDGREEFFAEADRRLEEAGEGRAFLTFLKGLRLVFVEDEAGEVWASVEHEERPGVRREITRAKLPRQTPARYSAKRIVCPDCTGGGYNRDRPFSSDHCTSCKGKTYITVLALEE